MARLALLSVSNKTGLVDFARSLITEFGFQIISSGGTAQALKDAGLAVTKVAEYTGSPEILGGRVKTLHPKIHGGILARRDVPEDLADLAANGMQAIDLVVVNLYPFQQTIAKPGVTLAEAIEQIDIGGPAMLRAAAKNHAYLTVLCNPSNYPTYLDQLRQGEPSLEFRRACAQEVFAHTASYDQAIAHYLATQDSANSPSLPEQFSLLGKELQPLRYGENPHQAASWYQTGDQPTGWAAATKLQGKELSYNNLVDLEAAKKIITEFTDIPAAAIIKHTNPCGVATGSTLVEAYDRAFTADSTSAFGGIVALNRPLDVATATALSKTFLECIVAPSCEPEAQAILAAKPNLRLLITPDLLHLSTAIAPTVKVITGGFLVQSPEEIIASAENWQVVTTKQPSPEELQELLFAWKVVKHVKSNAIVVTKDQVTLGIGAGQMNRVGSVKIALEQAGEKSQGGYLASDGFFPFDDSVKTAAAAGIKAIVQPGGSLRDKDSIQAANDLGLIMVLTGIRHFSH